MNSSLFSSARRRIDRAGRHITEMETEESTYFARHPYAIIKEAHHDRKMEFHKILFTQPPPTP